MVANAGGLSVRPAVVGAVQSTWSRQAIYGSTRCRGRAADARGWSTLASVRAKVTEHSGSLERSCIEPTPRIVPFFCLGIVPRESINERSIGFVERHWPPSRWQLRRANEPHESFEQELSGPRWLSPPDLLHTHDQQYEFLVASIALWYGA
jgi:hypothetical protein